MNRSVKKVRIAFGDFQTPSWLSKQVCALLLARDVQPASVLEPTCGQGSFLLAALDTFASATKLIGIDINPSYVEIARQKLALREDGYKVQTLHGNFFDFDWAKVCNQLPDPLLIIGNPPWVTNTHLASLGSDNIPDKKNFQNQPGIEAITGASNFDISEWMLLHLLQQIANRQAVMAMLCKTTVARKILQHLWHNGPPNGHSSLYRIDAQKAFNATVDACLLVYDTQTLTTKRECRVYSELSLSAYLTSIGYSDNQLIADLPLYKRWQHLERTQETNLYQWRSGIKHDCTRVMELKKVENTYVNQAGETYTLEETYIYPMLKSSDLSHEATLLPSRWMIVTQQSIGDSTLPIKRNAPRTWAYLQKHGEHLDRRRSAIYKSRPRFSIFGVGDYSFAPWKVAISGLYKKLRFVVVGPYTNKPVVLDDTCYFIPCRQEEEARFIACMLNTRIARQFFEAFIFWDAKRPITAKILRKLDLFILAQELGQHEVFCKFALPTELPVPVARQMRLLEEKTTYPEQEREEKI